MVQRARRRIRVWAPALVVGAIALLSIGTISNQLKINQANTRLKMQAEAGQRALTRQCSLLVVSRKLYADMLERHVISAEDFALVFSTAQQACRQR